VSFFERSIVDLVASLLESIRGLTAQCRELENSHNERLIELANVTLEKVNKGEVEEDVMDDLRDVCL